MDSRTAGQWYTDLGTAQMPDVLPSHRSDWAARYRETLGLSEVDDNEIIHKHV